MSIFTALAFAGTLEVSSDLVGASIQLNGVDTVYRTPASIPDISPGLVTVTVEKGCNRGQLQANVVSGRSTKVHISSMVEEGTLSVHPEPINSKVSLDGRSIPAGAPVPVACGSHTVLVEYAGYADQSLSVEVEDLKPVSLPVSLKKLGLASIELVVSPRSAQILLDGKPVGSDFVVLPSVTEGVHTIGAELDGYQTVAQRLTVKAGTSLSYQIKMKKKKPGQVIPSGASSEKAMGAVVAPVSSTAEAQKAEAARLAAEAAKREEEEAEAAKREEEEQEAAKKAEQERMAAEALKREEAKRAAEAAKREEEAEAAKREEEAAEVAEAAKREEEEREAAEAAKREESKREADREEEARAAAEAERRKDEEEEAQKRKEEAAIEAERQAEARERAEADRKKNPATLWTGVGILGVTAGSGAGALLSYNAAVQAERQASAKQEAADENPKLQDEADDAQADYELKRTIFYATSGLTGALLTTGVILVLVDEGPGILPLPGGAMLTWNVRF